MTLADELQAFLNSYNNREKTESELEFSRKASLIGSNATEKSMPQVSLIPRSQPSHVDYTDSTRISTQAKNFIASFCQQ